ncbi:MAG: hypothetical protein ACI399_04860 [Candidatus Cryptobacteroides sp.]
MTKKILKKAGIVAGIVLLFLVIAYSFVPQVLAGKVVNQTDITGYMSMSHQTVEWNAAHKGQETHWTDSMFGGMPTTSFLSSHEGDLTQGLYSLLLTGKRPATYLFISLLGAFLLLLSLGIDTIVAVAGAVAVTFCSYNIQIIQVGHNTKMQALAFLPWVMASVIFTYKSILRKGKGWKSWIPVTVLGSALFGLAMSLQVKANHQQITYYLAILLALYVLTYFIWLVVSPQRRKSLGRFFAASALLLVMGLLGIGTNAVKLAPLYEYTGYTMRGGSELSSTSGSEINEKGLQLDYATAWSYGWEELPNMMIPNFNGGSSTARVNPDKSSVVAVCKEYGLPNPEAMAESLPLYWGSQPFTAGPMYMGAITIFLFLLGLFIYEGKEKWWLLAATLLAVGLGLGRNFMWLTRLFFDYVPMYNKFRTVSMILVLLQFTLPLLGFLTLDRILKGGFPKKKILAGGLASLVLTAGFCLLVFFVPSIAGDFCSPYDSQMPQVLREALVSDRVYSFCSDALRSLCFIVAAFLLLLWACSVPKSAPESYENDPSIGRARRIEAVVGIAVLILVDLFSVGHRYLGNEDFVSARSFYNSFKKRPVDELILSDENLSFRVVDLTTNPFNDMFNGYFHKNVGGYSPAKLQRYQDLIDYYLTDEINAAIDSISRASTISDALSRLPSNEILSALNCKYYIFNSETLPLMNYNAYGNAWFVDSVLPASSPDEEISSIGGVNLREVAVIGDDFPASREAVASAVLSAVPDAADSIGMTSYAPGELHYRYSVATDRPAVFSEIYYPQGWVAEVDGEPVDIFRCDWILRGVLLPQGSHELVMKFCPEVYSKGKTASAACSWTLLILVLLSLAGIFTVSPCSGKTDGPSLRED